MNRRNLLSEKDKKRYSEFIRQFNQWLEEERKGRRMP